MGEAVNTNAQTFSLTVSRTMPIAPRALYAAWTVGWDVWFAEADTMRVHAEVGAPFFFEVAQRFENNTTIRRHPHYGRFLTLEPERLVSLTWVTGAGGTHGAETIVTVRLAPSGQGTELTLTHDGFVTEAARDGHAQAWPFVLEQQEKKLIASGDVIAARVGPVHNRSVPDATFIPVRSYPDLNEAVAWLRDVLGCRERLRIPGHRVQMTLGNGAVVARAWDERESPATGGRPPATLMVRVANIDAAYARALASGATGVSEPTDYSYGERQAQLRDPAGHAWTLTQTIADIDPATWGGELVG